MTLVVLEMGQSQYVYTAQLMSKLGELPAPYYYFTQDTRCPVLSNLDLKVRSKSPPLNLDIRTELKKPNRCQRRRIKRINVRARRCGVRNAKKRRQQDLELGRFQRLVVPPVIKISDDINRSRLIAFIHSFKQAILSGEKKILLDFSQTETIHAGGMILLYAEITRCVEAHAGIVFRCRVPRNNKKVAQVLVQLGLTRLFGEAVPTKPRFEDVVHWQVATGDDVRGEKYDDILGSYDGVIPAELSKSFFRGISEAMTNVRQHAYITVKKDLIPLPMNYNRWWMFSQKKDGKLSVIFCDLGIGIPKTIPKTRPGLWKKLSSLGAISNDADVIERTIQDSRSRTGLKHRGKGLPQIIDSVQSVDGTAGIYSNRGRFIATEKSEKLSFRRSVDGTIIFWQVDLPE